MQTEIRREKGRKETDQESSSSLSWNSLLDCHEIGMLMTDLATTMFGPFSICSP